MHGRIAHFSKGVFAQTKDVARNILPVLVLVFVVSRLAGYIRIDGIGLAWLLSYFVSVLTGAVVAYATCLCILSKGAVKGTDAFRGILSGNASLFVAAWAMPLVVFGLVGAVTEVALSLGENTVTWIMFLSASAVLVALSRYGTVYPAIVDGGDLSLRTAQGRTHMALVLLRIVAVIVCAIGACIAIVILNFIVMTALGLENSPVLDLVVGMVFSAVYLCMLVAAMVVLCNAYNGAYGEEPS